MLLSIFVDSRVYAMCAVIWYFTGKKF